MYLEYIELARTLPCLAEKGKIVIIGRPERPLDQVIPYMANLPGVIAYNPEARALTLRRQPGFMTLYPDQIYMVQVTDAQEGRRLLEALKEAVNAVWERRATLSPVTARKAAPRHLDIWSLLPQTNCGRCGEATCLAFAVTLLQHRHTLTDCPPLQEDAGFSDRRATLEAML
jgi:ArsR family metal-binding transcriptional regulator